MQRRLANQQAGAIPVRQIEHEVPEFLMIPYIFLSLLDSSRQEQL
jgi:hypothetical protein